MSGRRRGAAASLLRGVFGATEPIYSGVVSLRNRRFDAGRGVRKLPRRVISVGNITAGGTGKTPVVRWLCEQMRVKCRRPAVLMRGYKSAGGVSDEQRMLEQALNVADQTPIIVRANPDRFTSGTDVLREHPEVDLFVLDDGFQHRGLARDFDLVLVSAMEPFGFEHVHPRGLLREPLCGLRRADAVVITRADGVDGAALREIERRVREHQPKAPIYRANHVQTGLRSDRGTMAIEELAGKRVFAFCGIANPTSFFRQIEWRVGSLASSRAYSDHHAYSDADIAGIDEAAIVAKAEVIVTTEKDWAKLGSLAAAARTKVPIWRVEMAVQFWEGDEARLLEQIHL